ncbi:hypothetical protein U9M48_000202 [Paspalum notatum var. saurae]|uniref:Reverse transcriptase RNase H-like domain-containing protein n=1 Tax=Paspalum notatum var. saurae TaxID=547442 RepID=A0AAQ3PJX6_PASNO
MKICKKKIKFLGHEIGESKIYLQEHNANKILQFSDVMNNKKKLQEFLGIVNYARNYIDNLAKLAGPLYAKLRKNGQKYFNSEDIKLGAILKQKSNKYSPKTEEKICRYASGSYKLKAVNNTDREILAIINVINAFRLYLGFKEFMIRTDCEAIYRYYKQINSKKSSTRKWVLFEDIITGNGYKVIFEHIKGKDNRMKKEISFNGIETFTFGSENNKLRIFPPNSYKFRPKNHIILDEVQKCILDNFWYQYNHKREEKCYILSILNSLAEYFHTINSKMPPTEEHKYIERRFLYVIFEEKMPSLHISFEEAVAQKKDGKLDGGISWKKYGDIDEAMNQARKILGTNYYMEPAAKEYTQKYRKAKGIKIPETSSGIKDMAKKATYKDHLTKGVDPMDGQYIEMKIAQIIEMIFPEWKKTLKEEIMMELKGKLYNKLEEFKKDFDVKMDISLSGSEENNDIAGHGQRSE